MPVPPAAELHLGLAMLLAWHVSQALTCMLPTRPFFALSGEDPLTPRRPVRQLAVPTPRRQPFAAVSLPFCSLSTGHMFTMCCCLLCQYLGHVCPLGSADCSRASHDGKSAGNDSYRHAKTGTLACKLVSAETSCTQTMTAPGKLACSYMTIVKQDGYTT